MIQMTINSLILTTSKTSGGQEPLKHVCLSHGIEIAILEHFTLSGSTLTDHIMIMIIRYGILYIFASKLDLTGIKVQPLAGKRVHGEKQPQI